MESAEQDDEFAPLLGRVLADRYRVDKLLGRGGMGAVFRGHQLTLKRDVAIKVLHPELTRDEQVARRFEREARSTALLEHPNIVQVLESGATDDGYRYIVMQLLNGRELDAYMGSAMPPRLAVARVSQVFKALEHAHRNGVVHRDLKPENVFVTTDDEGHEVLKLVDFGIAKLTSGDEESGEKMTKLGLVFGTPQYMSPEQAMGLETDERTDLYSTGVMLHEMLAGQPPFVADDPIALIRMQVATAPPPLPEMVPAPLRLFVVKLLAKQREERFASASEARRALEAVAAELDGAAPAGSSLASAWATSVDPASAGVSAAAVSTTRATTTSTAATAMTATGSAAPPAARALPPSPVSVPDLASPTVPAVKLAPGALSARPAAPSEPSRALLFGIAAIGVFGLVIGAVLAFGGGKTTIGVTAPVGTTPSASHTAVTPAASEGLPTGVGNTLESKLQQIDRLLEMSEADAARKLVDDLLVSHENNAQVLWRSAKLDARRGSTQAKVKALETYARVLDIDAAILGDEAFFADLLALMRNSRVRGKATDLAIDRLGVRGYDFLIEKLNDPDAKDALSFEHRHRAIDVLSDHPDYVSRIDMELNLMRDLWQSLKTGRPCTDYATALEGIARHPSATLRDRLRTARVPSKPGTNESASMCASLDGWRQGLIIALALRFPSAGPSAAAAADAAFAANPSASENADSGEELVAEEEPTDRTAPAAPSKPAAAKPAAPKKKKTGFFKRLFDK